MSRSTTQTIAGVERALDVIALFAESGASDLGVTEIAEQLDLSKAVVHRILSSFRVKGFVEIDESTRRYRIGPRALTVGLSYLNRVDQVDVARSALEELADGTGETATQSVRAGQHAVCVSQVPSRHQVRVVAELGGIAPLHVGAPSLALLAFADPRSRDEYVVDGHGGDTQTLRTELDRVRERGFALSYDERAPGVAAVAAPLRDHTGRAVAALSVCGPGQRFREAQDEHIHTLLDVTTRVSAALGHGRSSSGELAAADA